MTPHPAAFRDQVVALPEARLVTSREERADDVAVLETRFDVVDQVRAISSASVREEAWFGTRPL